MKTTVQSFVRTVQRNETAKCIVLEKYLLGLKRGELVDSKEVLRRICFTRGVLKPSNLPARFKAYRHKTLTIDPSDGKKKMVVWWGRPESIANLKQQLELINQGGESENDHR